MVLHGVEILILEWAQSLGDNALKHKTVRSPSFFLSVVITSLVTDIYEFTRESKKSNFVNSRTAPMAADLV